MLYILSLGLHHVMLWSDWAAEQVFEKSIWDHILGKLSELLISQNQLTPPVDSYITIPLVQTLKLLRAGWNKYLFWEA